MSKIRSFDLVDFKVLETDFFLNEIKKTYGPPDTGFIFSAFVSAARSITFCLQAVLDHITGFSEWYLKKQSELKANKLARFFVEARNVSQKVGVVPISIGKREKTQNGIFESKFYFDTSNSDFKNLPNIEVTESCYQYFSILLSIVLDCYFKFGTIIDPHQFYTKANFDTLGKTIDDADLEVIGIRGYTEVAGWPEAYRWQAIRRTVPGCRLNDLFWEVLKKEKPCPPKLPEDPNLFDGNDWVPPCLR